MLCTVGPEDTILKDTREKTDGKPWRLSRELPFLSKDERYVLHETQQSLAVFGSNLDAWKSMMLHDTYYYPPDPNNSDTVKFYQDSDEDADAGSGSDSDSDLGFGGEWDPSTIGAKEASLVSADPWVGFFAPLLERAKQLDDDWTYTSSVVEKEVSNSVSLEEPIFS